MVERHSVLSPQNAGDNLAAKAGGELISPFIRRLDDINLDGSN